MKLTFLILSDYNKNKISLLVLTVLLFSCLAGNAKEQKASYQDDQIIITKSNSADKIIRITGKVTDTNGEPIIGANVSTKGTTLGTITDINGSFLLDVPSETVISISYIGYLTQEVKVKQQTSLNIVLKEDTQALEEVVVVGYGTVKRANLGGAVATADAKAFEARPVQNAVTALQGEVPGLTITRSGGGAPGAETTMKIRDVSSINGGTPLVLIDGAEGDINLINPSDIENVSVLKDGTAAIYGARASDGVVLITTKSGKRNQKTTVSFDAYYSVKTPALLKKTASLLQHAEMALEITDGSFPIEYTKEDLELIRQNSDQILTGVEWGRWGNIYPKFFKNQDWNDIVIGNGNMQNYNVNISGGGERYSYLVSLGHQREEGLPKFGKDLNKRYFVRAKSSIEIFKNLTYDLNLAYEASNRDYSSGLTEGQNIWELIYKTRSWAPLRNPAGNFYTFEGFDNPAQVLEEGGMASKTTGNVTVNNQLRWNVIDGLDLVGQAVIRKYDFDENVTNKIIYSRNWEDVNHRTARTPNNAERRYSKTLSKNFTLYADYKKNFNDLHDLSVMVGTSHESQNYDKFTAKRINFDQQENMSLQLGGSENQSAWSEGNAWTINSFFSRVNYTFKNRYIIEGTLRADGSSRFDPDHRWGYFPGVNAAWRLGEEGFMKNLNLFDDLKVRASYGEMGNQSGIGLYDYIQLISLSSDYYPFGGGTKGQMAKSGNIVSTSRTWETIQTTNIGLDFATLKNRLYGSFDYFWKENKNMLIPKTYPSMLGADAPSTNSGHLSIRGWEVALGWRDQINDFSYSVRFNLSDARNQVVERVGSNLIKLGLNETPTDYPLNSFFGYEFDGIIQNEQELKDYIARFPNGGIPGDLSVGDAKYKDLDGDGKLSVLGDGKEGSGDVKYLGDKNPRYNFGMNLSAAYKGFDFSAFIQGVGRRTMFLEGEASKPMAEAWFQSAAYWYGKTWTAERTDAQYPAITSTSKRGYNYYYSTNTKHNVGYARLKNLQLGYTIPSSVTAKIGLQKLRVYFSGEDLFEIHNTPGGWDPEEDGKITSYPFARNYSFGVNVVF
ncbi:TonB-dependent receptor [Parabacteroides sp. AF18-52]|jgi:TonB-linked outer membrane protein, SusC/RagA family/TonB-dependent outer membrane receptor, SusC/RagA subfamily, signature region|uniref:SusC/RagA family TonB-linked outer membrane protein n=2 Tax=Parabacteroides TaxID=375288 RepID=UPI001F2BA449|nr:TonB-dependent receptor [Parabacteroides sp. AF18-52]